jgi:hypothetical protein
MPSEKQVDLDHSVLVFRMRLERGALAIEKNLKGVPREALELVDLHPPVLVPTVLLVTRVVLRVRVAKNLERKLRMRLERGALAIEKNLIEVPREAQEPVDLLPPLLVPTVLPGLRVLLGKRDAKIDEMTKLQDLVHRDQRVTKRQRLEENGMAHLPFLELTLLPHRLQDGSKPNCHPQDPVL